MAAVRFLKRGGVTMSEQLQRRVQQLEREKRRWKRLALASMLATALTIGAGGVAFNTLVTRAARAAREQRLAAEEAARYAEEARQQKLRLEREAEKARR